MSPFDGRMRYGSGRHEQGHVLHDARLLEEKSMFNPFVTRGPSHPYHLDESIFIFRGIGSNILYFFIFL